MVHKLLQQAFTDDGKKKYYYVFYSVMFCIVAACCYSWFIIEGQSLVLNGDGWVQHLKALIYYGRYLRNIVRRLINDHSLVIQDFDFYLGEGSDVLSTMHYYVIGDPIALLSVMVPSRFMHYFLTFSCILRLYLSGIAFSALCFGTGLKNRYGILAGAISYCFCGWGIAAAMHPYFLNPMIYFPLMILGIEKTIRKEKPYLFIIIAAISAASNFYFFYMIVLLAVLYTLIRLGFLYRGQIRQGFMVLLDLGVMALTGVCIAGVILVPVLMIFLNDSRLSISQKFYWLYPWFYYSTLPSAALTITTPYWLCLGYTVPVILAVFLLFIKKGDRFLKTLFFAGCAIILFPIGGRILNGMSYMANRWSWAFSLLCTYILAGKWDELFSVRDREWKLMVILSTLYYAVCMTFARSRAASTLSLIPIFYLVLLIIKKECPDNKHKSKQAMLLLIVAANSVIISFWRNSPNGYNWVSKYMANSSIGDELINNEAYVVKEYAEGPFCRISGRNLTTNANILHDVSSTQYYWSISNPNMNRFRADLCMLEQSFFNYQGYDDRTTPTALSSVQLYVVNNDNSKGIPFGYSKEGKENVYPSVEKKLDELKKELDVEELSDEQISKIEGDLSKYYSFYKNEYSLPIAYCYDSYFNKDIWDSYDPVQKQEAQLESAYIDGELKEISFSDHKAADYSVPFEIECQGSEITQIENGFVTTSNGTKAVITLPNNNANSETYFGIKGLDFQKTAQYDLYFGDDSVDPLQLYNKTNWNLLNVTEKKDIRNEKKNWEYVNTAGITFESSGGVRKSLSYVPPEGTFSSGRHDYIVNLGYSEEGVTTITITFPYCGVYTFDDLTVYSIPMDKYAEKIGRLKENVLQDVQFGIDTVSGNISLEDDQLMCLAIPFSEGWKAYIDGREEETYCLNERYVGVVVPAGRHNVRFHYSEPYKKTGCLVSVMGIAAFVFIIAGRRNARTGSK